jgi:predicted alpha/beta hydrolase
MSERAGDVAVPARDGHPLAATFYQPDAGPSDRLVLIGSAMGVPRRFYARFARYLCGQGFGVLTFDYRGSGRSARSKPREESALHDWGELDLAGAIDWGAKTGARGIALIAHSASAGLIGLADNNRRLDAIVLVAPQSGYWRLFDGTMKLAVAFAWFVAIPISAALLGRLPGWFLGGTDLPRNVAREWARWGRHPDHILSYRPEVGAGFARIDAPLLVYSFADDRFAPPPAVAAILGWYGSAQQERRVLSPDDGGPIGHFRFFTERFGDTAWRETAQWLTAALAKERIPRPLS